MSSMEEPAAEDLCLRHTSANPSARVYYAVCLHIQIASMLYQLTAN